VDRYDAVVVGAGPYGLSAAAHLNGRGLRVAVFGKTLELWRCRMPAGMRLRSHAWATSLSDPRGRYSFGRFCGESGRRADYPVPRELFIAYALWFEQHAVPGVDQTYVASVERASDGFHLTLDDGRTARSKAVVMATGLAAYAHRPEEYAGLPEGVVSHSCDGGDFSRFRGSRVVVVGGGQSAIEYAALLNEAGAMVHVVSRRPIVWLAPDPGAARTWLDRMRQPDASIAPGWKNWILDRAPYTFYRFPQNRKDRANRNYYTSAASDWLRGRVIGHVALHEARSIVEVARANGSVAATLSDGETVHADHVMLATGYRVDLNTLTMIHPALRTVIAVDRGVPVLNAWFESSVPGLYFIGFTSLRAFGPLYRFVAGCGAAARRVTRHIARHS